MRHTHSRLLASALGLLLAAGCGGGGSTGPVGSSTPAQAGGTATSGGMATAQAAAGVWEGSVSSQSTGQAVPVLGFVDARGMSAWMTADGRVLAGPMAGMSVGGRSPMAAFVDGGAAFPTGAPGGPMTFMLEALDPGAISGRFDGLGEGFGMRATMAAAFNRPASLATLAGVYSRATSAGYTISMAIDATGSFTANDSRGCTIGGTAKVPDAMRNLYELAATVTSCGALNGTYAGAGTLLDATAMTAWMQRMAPIAHGGTSSGGMMGGGPMQGPGGMMGGQNALPSGARNLFMFVLVNDAHAIMDALAR
jgi:hypothetical protein